jgi:hypothetical protein
MSLSFAALVTAAPSAAAENLCPTGAPSAPHPTAIFPAPMPGQTLEVDWNASQPCIGDGGTLQYDVYSTFYDGNLLQVGSPLKIGHIMAGDTQTPGLYAKFFPDNFNCKLMYQTVTVYAWSVNNAHRSDPGVSNPVSNTGYGLCPGPLRP